MCVSVEIHEQKKKRKKQVSSRVLATRASPIVVTRGLFDQGLVIAIDLPPPPRISRLPSARVTLE